MLFESNIWPSNISQEMLRATCDSQNNKKDKYIIYISF